MNLTSMERKGSTWRARLHLASLLRLSPMEVPVPRPSLPLGPGVS